MSDHTAPEIIIRQGDIQTCVRLSRQIPEFVDPPAEDTYRRRLAGVPHLLLIAYVDGRPAGFKAGYQREDYFYSWMGGILPSYRRLGLAGALASEQENWAKTQGYRRIVFKTRNQHKAMLIFALNNGFDIIGFQAKEEIAANRILLQKAL